MTKFLLTLFVQCICVVIVSQTDNSLNSDTTDANLMMLSSIELTAHEDDLPPQNVKVIGVSLPTDSGMTNTGMVKMEYQLSEDGWPINIQIKSNSLNSVVYENAARGIVNNFRCVDCQFLHGTKHLVVVQFPNLNVQFTQTWQRNDTTFTRHSEYHSIPKILDHDLEWTFSRQKRINMIAEKRIQTRIYQAEDWTQDALQIARYPGGNEALELFLELNMIYPKRAAKFGITGSVFVDFCVSETGL